MTHELKSLPMFFDAVESGRKTFEIRKDDRGFNPGDTLILREWIPQQDHEHSEHAAHYSGRSINMRATYITDFEQQPGYVVMAIVPAESVLE